MFLRSLALSAFVMLAACSGKEEPVGDDDDVAGDDDDTTGDDDDTIGDDDDDDTAGDDDDDDTSTSKVIIDGQLVIFNAQFAYDVATDMAVPYEDPTYGPVPIIFQVIIGDSSIQTSGAITPANSCSVVLQTNTPQPMVSFANVVDPWWGFEMPADATVAFEDCSEVELPAEFAGDAAGAVLARTFGITLGDVDATLLPSLEADPNWASLEPLIFGAGAFADTLVDNLNASGVLPGIGQAYNVDANFALIVDATGNASPVEAAVLYDGTAMSSSAFISVNTVGVSTAVDVLQP